MDSPSQHPLDQFKGAAWDSNLAKISWDRAATEVGSWGVFIGASWVLDQAITKTGADAVIGKYVIKPLALKPLDWAFDNPLSALETDEEASLRHHENDDVRARHYARTIGKNAGSAVITMAAQEAFQRVLDSARGVGEDGGTFAQQLEEADGIGARAGVFTKALVNKEMTGGDPDANKGFFAKMWEGPNAKATLFDKVTQISALGVLNGPMRGINEEWQAGLRSALEKHGLNHEKATEVSRLAVNGIAPNLLGAVACVGALAYQYDSPGR